MKIQRLTDLFSSLSQRGDSQTNINTAKQAAPEEVKVLRPNPEAVRIAADLNRTALEDPSVRKARVDELKAKVQNGSYRPDSRDVAEALARELFV